MHFAPQSVISSWPKPNYVDPEDRSNGIIIASAVCIGIILLILTTRIYTRIHINKFFGLDDYLVIFAAIIGIGYCVLGIAASWHGWYKHVWDVPLDKVVEARKFAVASSFLGLWNVAFTKIAVLVLYWRVFPPSQDYNIRLAVTILLGIVIAWLISMSTTTFLFCIPMQAYWDLSYKGPATCLNDVPYFVAFSSIDLILDIVLVILPWPKLVTLSLNRSQKVVVYILFSMGLFAVAAAALRLPSLVRVSSSYDFSWELYDVVLKTEIEACVSLLCASASSLRPLIQRCVSGTWSTFSSRSRSGPWDTDCEATHATSLGFNSRIYITTSFGPEMQMTRGGKTESKADLMRNDDEVPVLPRIAKV